MPLHYIPLFILATIATFILHEGAHFAIGEALGYDMWVNINSAGLVRGAYAHDWQAHLVSAAGPLITLAQGIIAYVMVRKRRSVLAFGFLFAALLMRVVAMMMTLTQPNDEARISEWLGFGPWTLHIAVVALLLWLTVRSGLHLKLRWTGWLMTYVAVSIGIASVVLGESYIPRFNPYA